MSKDSVFSIDFYGKHGTSVSSGDTIPVFFEEIEIGKAVITSRVKSINYPRFAAQFYPDPVYFTKPEYSCGCPLLIALSRGPTLVVCRESLSKPSQITRSMGFFENGFPEKLIKSEPKCDCGAAHTDFPQFHSDWCQMYTGRLA